MRLLHLPIDAARDVSHRDRYGGHSIALNLFVSAFGGTTAAVMGGLVLATGDLNWPGYYLITAGVVGVISVELLH